MKNMQERWENLIEESRLHEEEGKLHSKFHKIQTHAFKILNTTNTEGVIIPYSNLFNTEFDTLDYLDNQKHFIKLFEEFEFKGSLNMTSVYIDNGKGNNGGEGNAFRFNIDRVALDNTMKMMDQGVRAIEIAKTVISICQNSRI